MPLPALDTITGALLIGTWANSLLYMAELMQARYYFRHFKHDDWKLKTFVSVAVLVDTISTLGDYVCVYLFHADDPVYLADQHWPLSLHLFTTAVIAILVQSFLVVRYWRLTRNILVTLLNSFLVIVALGGSFACAVILAMFPAFEDREKIKIPATIWLVTAAVVDLSIAAALLWQLRKIRPTLVETRRCGISGCRLRRNLWLITVAATLNSVLDQLVALTIQSGTATATLAVAALIG
ncbi:hypothetical protein B0H19DRAFT_1334348 [Mycena capillaripes]|nr:hypothetical protein B0H19DRAFT_1334348 [Mycena capillaripes]